MFKPFDGQKNGTSGLYRGDELVGYSMMQEAARQCVIYVFVLGEDDSVTGARAQHLSDSTDLDDFWGTYNPDRKFSAFKMFIEDQSPNHRRN